MVDLRDGLRLVVIAVHAALRTLVVHDVEFLVEERVKIDLAFFEPAFDTLKAALGHIFDHSFLLRYFKVVPDSFVGLHFLVAQVDFVLRVKLLVGGCLFLFPI